VINGKQIDDEYISNFISEHEKYIDDCELTFFEVTTAMAFQYFAHMKPDYCVIETGLGGRLDATNVLNPLAVVITTISLEHTNVLGNTIEQIAAEKAAIIKNGSKVFSGILKKEAEDIVCTKCAEMKCELYQLKDFISVNAIEVKIFSDREVVKLNPPLKGYYQKLNAALAGLTISKTFSFDDKQKYINGILNLVKNTGIECRYEYYHNRPTIIFDSAHNPEGIENFLNEYANESLNYKERILIFGAMQDKAIGTMLQMLSRHFDEILLSEIKYERAAKPKFIKELCDQLNIPAQVIRNPGRFVENFKRNGKDECLVVLGSMYLLGEIKQQLLQGTS